MREGHYRHQYVGIMLYKCCKLHILSTLRILALKVLVPIAVTFLAFDPLQSTAQNSSDMTPVAIPFGMKVYNIPRHYLAGVTQPTASNSYAAFTLYVLLPDLAPRTPATAGALDRLGWHDQLRALVQYGKVPRPREDLLRFYLTIAKRSESDFQLVDGRYKLYDLPGNAPPEIYTADTRHGLFLFTCNRASDYKIPTTPYCTVMEDLGDNVGMTYSFGRDHLTEALEIDDRLCTLLESFVGK